MLQIQWNTYKDNYKKIFVFTFLWGIVTHGIMMFNKFSFFDEIHYMFGVGHTYPLGRWMLGILEKITRLAFGSPIYSLPVLNGAISLLGIAIAVCIMVRIIEVENKWSLLAISGLMVTFPTITCMFGYMYTAPYYMIGLVLAMVSVYVICIGTKRWYKIIIGGILFACAIGIYQALIPLVLCVVLIYLLNQIQKDRVQEWSVLINQTIYLGIYGILSLGIYYVILKLSGSELSGYKGADSLFVSNLAEYKWRIILAYKEFFVPSGENEYLFWNVFPWNMEIVYKIVVGLIIVLSVWRVWKLFRKKTVLGIWYGGLFLSLPLAVNFIFIMVDKWSVYALTNYAQVMVFIYFIWQIENIRLSRKKEINEYIYGAGIAVMLFAGISYSRYANVCYLNAELMTSQMTSYYTTLTTRIQSIEGYKDELPIAFIGGGDKQDENWYDGEEFEEIAIEAYRWDTTINDNSWIGFMKYYCGYEPTMIEDIEEYENMQQVMEMPSYPDDGGIAIIDEVIVVKF